MAGMEALVGQRKVVFEIGKDGRSGLLLRVDVRCGGEGQEGGVAYCRVPDSTGVDRQDRCVLVRTVADWCVKAGAAR
jgi:hypothetical protein